MPVYRTAQEAVLAAKAAGILPPELAALINEEGLVGGELNPGHMREFDRFTGQVHGQFRTPGPPVNPGLPYLENNIPNQLPVYGQAAFSFDPREWALSQAGRPQQFAQMPLGGMPPLAPPSTPSPSTSPSTPLPPSNPPRGGIRNPSNPGGLPPGGRIDPAITAGWPRSPVQGPFLPDDPRGWSPTDPRVLHRPGVPREDVDGTRGPGGPSDRGQLEEDRKLQRRSAIGEALMGGGRSAVAGLYTPNYRGK